MSSGTIDKEKLAEAQAQVEQQPSYISYKADLIYGASDSGKTKNIGDAVDYILRRYSKLSRIITADGGGVGPLGGMAKSGLLEVWAIGGWTNPIAAMQKAVKGWWPTRLDDPEAPLAPPDAGTGEIYGLLGIEGLTSWGDRVLMSLKEDKASLSQDPSYTFVQGSESFSGGNKSYYGFIQDQLYSWVTLSHLLPYTKIIWTALESRGDDQDGIPIYGPAIAGRKAIGKATQWFCNTVHLDVVDRPPEEVEVNGAKVLVVKTERVMWTRTHAEVRSKINFPCKVRVAPQFAAQVPALITPPNIGTLYELLDKLEQQQMEQSSKQMNEVEAVRERLQQAAQKARERAEKAAMEKQKRSTVAGPQFVAPLVPATTGIVSTTPAAAPVAAPVAPVAAPVQPPGQVAVIRPLPVKPKEI